jgi:class 3 adenylate cyclase
MALVEELTQSVKSMFADPWSTTAGRVVPEPSAVSLGNHAIELESATVLYADLDGSTAMVDQKIWQFSAEIYKVYLHCAARIIRSQDGVITAYDGDRVMAVYLGERKNTRAVLTALKLNWAVTYLINPAIVAQYSRSTFQIRHNVGIDTSALRVARTGVRGDNDLVWVGRAANYAAKLTTLSSDFPTRITHDVYSVMAEDAKYSGDDDMWEPRLWTPMNNLRIYRSSWWMKL